MTSPSKKYLVRPGRIRSINDGDLHFIEAEELMRLYGVRRQECIIMGGFRDRGIYGTFILLEPQYSPKAYHLSLCPIVVIEQGEVVSRTG